MRTIQLESLVDLDKKSIELNKWNYLCNNLFEEYKIRLLDFMLQIFR